MILCLLAVLMPACTRGQLGEECVEASAVSLCDAMACMPSSIGNASLSTCQLCTSNADCQFGFNAVYRECYAPLTGSDSADADADPVCRTKRVFGPFGWRDALSSVLVFLSALVASGCGIGGGPLYVPLFVLMDWGKAAVQRSLAAITGLSMAVNFITLRQHYTSVKPYGRPLVDYHTVLVVVPPALLGTVVGRLVNSVLPTSILYVLLDVLLLAMSIRTCGKVVRLCRRDAVDRRQNAKSVRESIALAAAEALGGGLTGIVRTHDSPPRGAQSGGSITSDGTAANDADEIECEPLTTTGVELTERGEAAAQSPASSSPPRDVLDLAVPGEALQTAFAERAASAASVREKLQRLWAELSTPTAELSTPTADGTSGEGTAMVFANSLMAPDSRAPSRSARKRPSTPQRSALNPSTERALTFLESFDVGAASGSESEGAKSPATGGTASAPSSDSISTGSVTPTTAIQLSVATTLILQIDDVCELLEPMWTAVGAPRLPFCPCPKFERVWLAVLAFHRRMSSCTCGRRGCLCRRRKASAPPEQEEHTATSALRPLETADQIAFFRTSLEGLVERFGARKGQLTEREFADLATYLHSLTAPLNALLHRESYIPVLTVVLFVACWCGVLLLQVLIKFTTEQCTPANFTGTLAFVPYLATFTAIGCAAQYVRHRRKQTLLCPPYSADMRWDLRRTLTVPAPFLLAGVLPALVGGGGGMMTSLLTLEIGMDPEIASGTVALISLFTSSIASVLYLLDGLSEWDYFLWYAAVTFVAGIVGRNVVGWLLKKTGLVSIVVVILATIMVVAFFLTLWVAIRRLVMDYAAGVQIALSSPC